MTKRYIGSDFVKKGFHGVMPTGGQETERTGLLQGNTESD